LKKSVIALVGLSFLLLTGCAQSQASEQTNTPSTANPVKSLYTSNGVTILEDMQTGDLIYETNKGVTTVSSALFSSNQIKNLESKGYAPADSSQLQTSTNTPSTTDTIKSLYTSNGVTVLEDVQTGDLIYETDSGVTVVSTTLFGNNQIKNLESKGYVPVK
jgi:PBP1b-binding outer membrane lipoprotein LpoB